MATDAPPLISDAEPTLGQLVASASRDVSTILRSAIALAKTEITGAAKFAGKGAGMFAGAAFFGLFGLGFLLTALAWGLVALGLAIVAAIARMHGGRPFASSANGTTSIGFTLLPATGVSAAPSATAPSPS